MFSHKFFAKTGNGLALRACLALAGMLALTACGGVTTTTTTTYDPATQKPTTTVTKMDGSVEGMAAVEKARAAPHIVAAVQALGTTMTIPRGFDENGKPLKPLVLRVTDSRAYDVLLAAMDFSKFETPGVKIASEVLKTLRSLGPIGLLTWGFQSAFGNAGTTTNTTYNASVSGRQNGLSITPGSGNAIGMSPVSQITYGDQAPIGDGNRGLIDNGYYQSD